MNKMLEVIKFMLWRKFFFSIIIDLKKIIRLQNFIIIIIFVESFVEIIFGIFVLKKIDL